MQKELKPYRVALTLSVGNSKAIEASGLVLALNESDAHQTLDSELRKARKASTLSLTRPVGFASESPQEIQAQPTLCWDTLVVKSPRGASVNVSDKLGGTGVPTEQFAHILVETEAPE